MVPSKELDFSLNSLHASVHVFMESDSELQLEPRVLPTFLYILEN